jgi:ribose 5-phosphate isomerase B
LLIVLTRSSEIQKISEAMMNVGIAADHGGFALKQRLVKSLREAGYEVVDFGAAAFVPGDDYSDYVVPLARAVARGHVERGIAICGNGIGACVAANKVRGVRAGLCEDHCVARQGVEDDAMNVLCLGAGVVGPAVGWDLVQTFLGTRFNEAERHRRRLAKLAEVEEHAEA